MPELHFKGKEYVYNHHLTVPYRPLVAHPDKSIGDKAGNLIIHGDNLHALKALLPRYAGKVDCIFIDPPYNTGNENWNYNDNVDSPIMREWLDGNPVNKEDMLRHDKWCCLMYPRLKLLHELLSESGSFWMTLDDNEIHRARMVMDEIFGEDNFVAACIWQKNFSPKNTAKHFSEDHDYLIVYAKDASSWLPRLLPRTEEMEGRFTNPDNDSRGVWSSSDMAARNYYSEGRYPVTCPSGRVLDGPPPGTYWRVKESKFKELDADNRIWWGAEGNNVPRIKRFLTEVKEGRVPQTLWFWKEVGHTQDAKKELLEVMNFGSQDDVFITPKPKALVERILHLATTSESLVLDSFAGSATTAHAVLAQNAKDDGNRRFILVECEGYADTLTAERVRRVIAGYRFQGTQKEELLREKITWSNFNGGKAHRRLLDQVRSLENLESHRFDDIKKTVKEGELIVTGETRITERVGGLGGGFTYYTLGDPLDLDKMLTGESLPDYASIGAWLFHTATGKPLDPKGIREEQSYLGESAAFHVWLIYKPELDFLKSRDAALTLRFAEKISEQRDKHHLVFAPAHFVPNKVLLPLGVEHAPLPFALYRFERN
uniref:site-specific DNA-methyltransferase (adenine-specific) n=1 Tax=Candidatus Kentrum sp. LFY TaxID=2126342 RepID=A0A450V431_9GAMM|nr:MAG: adenine-specific DNA-methyltransferase [Candidatus Kentron sp. LFY]